MSKRHFLEFEQPIAELEAKIDELRFVSSDAEVNIGEEIARLRARSRALTTSIFAGLTPWQVAQLARHPQRPYTLDYVARLAKGDPAEPLNAFKDKLVQAVKDNVNATLNAKVDFGDFDLSLFRSFPDFSFPDFGFQGFSIPNSPTPSWRIRSASLRFPTHSAPDRHPGMA